MKVIIRDLELSDGLISWKWRNDPIIWEKTGRKWNNRVTKEMEINWLSDVLKRTNEKRFAICVNTNKQYIGNVQLTDITETRAQFHIFIGEKSFWGKGIGTKATRLILEYAFSMLKLKEVYLYVNVNNIPAIRAYEKSGFVKLRKTNDDFEMIVKNERFQ